MLPARIRLGDAWSDACILNISSRGLMIHSGRGVMQGSLVELRRGEQIIIGRVVWRNGSRAGLQCDGRLPVDEILSLSQAASLQLTAVGGKRVERRKKPRHDESRMRARAMEFASVAVIAACLGAGLFAMVEQAFARPIAIVESALGG